MKTLIIYDSTGVIFSSPITGSYASPQGDLNYLEVEIPDGSVLTGVDVSATPHVPIYEEVETDADKITNLQTTLAEVTYALMIGGLI